MNEELQNRVKSTRRIRNRLLSLCDWTLLSDNGLSDAEKGLWRVYRQSLRDITTHENWPDLELEEWPTDPNGKHNLWEE